MDYIPDYNELYSEYERQQERLLDKYPKCDNCEEPITDEHFYNIDGTFICEECMRNMYRVDTDDYIEE